MTISDLPTPSLLLDKDRLTANLSRMTGRLKAHGVNLRPHLKTAKSIDVARLAINGNFGGITVSTLKEADYFFGHGIKDIVYAVCIEPGKLDQAAVLSARGCDLKIITDNAAAARAIAGHGGTFKVLIEIDCGEHRTGIAPDHPAVLEIAECLADSENTALAGVMTHAGHSYKCRDLDATRAVARDEREAVIAAAGRLRAAGHGFDIVSVGSTPTVMCADSFDGLTEARPGVYGFLDLFQAGIGVCRVDDIALSVLASVISVRPDEQCVLIDAGGLALSKDRSTGALENDLGFGLVCDAETGQPLDRLIVEGVHQEHGQINLPDPAWLDKLPVGARVRVLPNHACMTAAAHERYNVVSDGEVVDRWARCNGW